MNPTMSLTPMLWTTRLRAAAPAPVSEPESGGFHDWMREHSVAVSSGLQLVGQGCYAMSGKEFHSWARSGSALSNASGTVLGALYGNHPQETDDEEVRWQDRFKQAFDPKGHIRQTIGLTSMVAGILGLYSGISSERVGEAVSGAVTSLSGGLLMFSKHNADGWERMSALNLAVLTPAGFYHAYEAGDAWVGAGEVAQTLSDAVNYAYTRKVAEERAQTKAVAAKL